MTKDRDKGRRDGYIPKASQTDFHVHLKSTVSQQGVVHHIFPVSHANDQHIVHFVHTIHLGEQLVDCRVNDTRTITDAATLQSPKLTAHQSQSGGVR